MRGGVFVVLRDPLPDAHRILIDAPPAKLVSDRLWRFNDAATHRECAARRIYSSAGWKWTPEFTD
jgi:hypothetical protein